MESVFKDFGIQPILLAAQVVNFVVLLFLLKKFLYKPLLKVLEERRSRVIKSLKDSEEIEEKLIKTAEEQERMLARASKQAQEIVENATKSADQIILEAHQKAQDETKELLARTQENLKAEKEKLFQEVRVEVAHLLSMGLERVIGKMLNKEDQQDLIRRSIKDL